MERVGRDEELRCRGRTALDLAGEDLDRAEIEEMMLWSYSCLREI